MAGRLPGYHWSVTDTALLVIDMFNDYRHPDAEPLAANVAAIIDPLVGLVGEAEHNRGVDLIYVNDNHGDFTADHRAIISAALDGERPDLVKPLLPKAGCRIITKVRHSVFYATALEYLLDRLKARRIVLTGQVTEQCILYSALDGYLRHYDVVVPPDAVAHIDEELGAAALTMMERNMSATLLPAERCLR
ncbi:Peroxyureidoacrylate/ureidoacrylate amidohydrolase RutB [Mycobacterium pseudokansasii]|uniref:Peroxyureidoacrylate/ureidoacrylate amidohydrolase RutB n=1 Tax=Mycobacterium pseudokansasii TaxID=2341080 RepID=A0A498QYK6_9MYCO|nr:Peroxyureidoacrylate/ureidoacrylate amidohydrolase RutB [Mycobacterium pseudokansasii]VBA34938.1 Peroxyureidoacrylate/ureidoacrylate amidohydrolase RutB [Mycobacterium pseudokansasii]VBA56108.1 Peroxyureidoacrylate/ureidoacrylate amidohydrolase RutB [Mycobacterium pseudokansasii]